MSTKMDIDLDTNADIGTDVDRLMASQTPTPPSCLLGEGFRAPGLYLELSSMASDLR